MSQSPHASSECLVPGESIGNSLASQRLPRSVFPAAQDLLDLFDWMTDEWAANHDFELPPIQFAYAVLARWGHPAPPPADGEVAELVEWLQEEADDYEHEYIGCEDSAAKCKRAAELLQRQALVPVPVSERPWEREGWCDELGRCWWGRPDTGDWSADWTLATPEAIAEFCEFSPQTVCLPAHALPLPEVGE